MESQTAKNFVLQLSSLISLYLSLSFFLVLAFSVINVAFPDVAEDIWSINQNESSIRFGIAMVVVFFPTYLITTRYVNKVRRSETAGKYLGLTKWLIYLSLLVGGGVLLGDLVAVISAFLEGEITQRFILKALAVLLVVGGAFYYYILDARGYWMNHEKKSISIGALIAAVVVATVVYGFYSIKAPEEVRERRIDEQQLADLQDIQYRIQDYLRTNETLPETIEELYVNDAPTAPEGRTDYEYTFTEEDFELCATFAYPSDDTNRVAVPLEKDALIGGFYNWEHSAGRFCFERILTVE